LSLRHVWMVAAAVISFTVSFIFTTVTRKQRPFA